MKPNMRVVALLAVFLLLPTFSNALTLQQKALVGLKGVGVVVEVEPEAKRLGLTPEQIKTDVELRLRKAGVGVLTAEERFKTPGAPYLYVTVTIYMLATTGPYSRGCAFSHLEGLYEIVTLANGFKTDGAIWSTAGVGAVDIDEMETYIRRLVGDRVDGFINDYLEANPK
jgi:hypothetical protein